MGESRSQRKRTISQSKVPIDETIHQLLEIYHGVKTCAFQEYNKYNQGQNQKDLIYDISFRFFAAAYMKNVVVSVHISKLGPH